MFIAEINSINDPVQGTTALIGTRPEFAFIAKSFNGKWEPIGVMYFPSRQVRELQAPFELPKGARQALAAELARYN